MNDTPLQAWVVDDDASVRWVLDKALAGAGIATRSFDGAESFLAALGPERPDVVITDTALDETVYEPDAPVLRKGKTLSEEEKEDRALRDRTRHDAYLRRATDVLLGLKALGYGRQH